MTTCHLCDRERMVEDLPLCDAHTTAYEAAPEGVADLADWERTGAIVRPHPDPWWPRSQARTASYIRRVQTERRNGGAK